jgi:hypothetical protein
VKRYVVTEGFDAQGHEGQYRTIVHAHNGLNDPSIIIQQKLDAKHAHIILSGNDEIIALRDALSDVLNGDAA